jgi:hypothetical protein
VDGARPDAVAHASGQLGSHGEDEHARHEHGDAADEADPQASGPKGPGSGDCKVSDYRFTASTATYKMVCTKPMPMTAVGEMKYSGSDAYVGTMTIDSGGQKMTMSYDAKRVGDCPK